MPIQRSPRPVARRFGVVLAGALVAGSLPACAVLTVDVDVYKGPLSTEPSLQLEQACGMVDGVRPVLEQLRTETDTTIRDPALVTDILGLYDDLADKPILAAAARLTTAAEKWSTAAADAVPSARRETLENAARLAELLDPSIRTQNDALRDLVDAALLTVRPGDPTSIVEESSADASQRASFEKFKVKTDLVGRAPTPDAVATLLRDVPVSPEQLPLVGDVASRVRVAKRFAAIPRYFGSSRPVKGLDTVVRNYRNAANTGADVPADIEAAVIHTLTAFATRILAFTNAQPLLAPNSPAWFTDTLANTINNSIGTEFHPSDKEYIRTRRYQSVLQAIGNELLAQVDAIQARHGVTPQRLSVQQMTGALRANHVATSIAELGVAVRADLIRARQALAAAEKTGVEVDIARAKASIAACELVVRTADELQRNQVFILPAATYLKSAVRTTRVQDGTAVGWANELQRHARRMEPLDSLLADGSDAELELRKELDRQAWQNINQIRVAASGDTTYALVKDDVGNWYVKGFSGDPKPIIDGATGIALRGFGAAHGLDAAAVMAGEQSAQDAVKGSVRGKQIAAVRKEYLAQARRDADALHREFQAVGDDLVGALGASPKFKAGLSLDAARTRVRAAADRRVAAWTATPEFSSKEGMNAVRSFHRGIDELQGFATDVRRLLGGDELLQTPAKTDAEVVAARTAGEEAVRAVVDALVTRQLAARAAARDAAVAKRNAIADTSGGGSN